MQLLVSSVLTPAALLPDASSMLHAFGPWVLAGIALLIFIESGVLFPFLPGDSLLVTAAILAGPLGIQPWQVILVGIPAAVLGDQVGYVLGTRYGRRLFRDDARVLRTSRLAETERFFERFGALSLVLGRFVPIVRTYVPLVAGTVRLPYRRFLLWNAIGAVAWVCGMTGIGLLVGGLPGVVDNIDLLMIAIIVVSVAPVAITGMRGMVRARRQQGEDAAIASDPDRGKTAADPNQAGVPRR
ncbi:membrane-associated protein [Microbacterium azadirachtae]|uniref:Membrane-associated protein n=1 Tax=Microbacterium azadirachtae TaxID=582680 RepID=A0A1I6HE68_9MICO|nr:VTT domain-containing protein [Microbacterium azadirachtae]SFR52671.1 membrane-associated protein [Microbacterium azadirachtae]